MIAINVTEFRRNQKKYFALSETERVIIHRGNSPAIVLCPLAELDETDFLLSTPNNKKHILEGLNELNSGLGKKINIEDLWK